MEQALKRCQVERVEQAFRPALRRYKDSTLAPEGHALAHSMPSEAKAQVLAVSHRRPKGLLHPLGFEGENLNRVSEEATKNK